MENREVDDNVHKAEVKNCVQLLRQLQGNVSAAEKVQACKRKRFFVCFLFKKKAPTTNHKPKSEEQRSPGRVWIPHRLVAVPLSLTAPLCVPAGVCRTSLQSTDTSQGFLWELGRARRCFKINSPPNSRVRGEGTQRRSPFCRS